MRALLVSVCVVLLAACSPSTTQDETMGDSTTTTRDSTTIMTIVGTTLHIDRPPPATGSWGIPEAPEDCEGYYEGFYQPHGTSWSDLADVGYLTGERLTAGTVDHVVGLEEAWCSGIRSAEFGADPRNLRAASLPVDRGKGGRDPAEWWATPGETSPARVDYPGWCDYLDLHVQVKAAWGGTMDREEHAFLARRLDGCAGDHTVSTTTPVEA